jgi:dTDP-4-amino-4,6-dideoxygalactose transaminase
MDGTEFAGGGRFTKLAEIEIGKFNQTQNTFLTSSCTQSLEFATLLLELKPGDEVILPSFNFTSAAIALANFGVVPVFVDIDKTSKNINVEQIGIAITPRTRAISVVNYAGVTCEFGAIKEIATEYGLKIIEDNAHGLGGVIDDKRLGSFGHISTQSFHESKNIHCGEGGSIAISTTDLVERAYYLRDKGTNRQQFLDGQIDKYSWVDLGGSYLQAEILSAVLYGHLTDYESIHTDRLHTWNQYFAKLGDWAVANDFSLPFIPAGNSNVAHMFYIVAPDQKNRDALISHLKKNGVDARFHYQALHKSKAGLKYGRSAVSCDVSDQISASLLRLPLWVGMTEDQIDQVISSVQSYSTLTA